MNEMWKSTLSPSLASTGATAFSTSTPYGHFDMTKNSSFVGWSTTRAARVADAMPPCVDVDVDVGFGAGPLEASSLLGFSHASNTIDGNNIAILISGRMGWF